MIFSSPKSHGTTRKVARLALDFLVQCMPTKVLVELLLLNRFGLRFLVSSAHITRRGLALFSRLRAFQNNMFPWHNELKHIVMDDGGNTKSQLKEVAIRLLQRQI